jgi:hypothetical protein
MRFVSWTIILLAALGAASLLGLPLLAENAAEGVRTERPAALPDPPRKPERLIEPAATVEELGKALRLPRFDEGPRDAHTRASLAAYRDEDYERAFQEAVLALDPTPIRENRLIKVLTNSPLEYVEKSNGRQAIKSIDDTLKPLVEEGSPQTAARLNNAAAMMVLRDFTAGETATDMGILAARELAYQSADVEPSCPNLLNLTLLDGGTFRSRCPAGAGCDPQRLLDGLLPGGVLRGPGALLPPRAELRSRRPGLRSESCRLLSGSSATSRTRT